jgi:hypothetical protein
MHFSSDLRQIVRQYERALRDQRHEMAMAFDSELSRRRVTVDEAEADFYHLIWERVAGAEGLDYDRYSGDRIDAD